VHPQQGVYVAFCSTDFEAEAVAALPSPGNGWKQHAAVHPLYGPSILGQSMAQTGRA